MNASMSARSKARSLPSFIGRTYTLYETRIFGRQCVIVAKLGCVRHMVCFGNHFRILILIP